MPTRAEISSRVVEVRDLYAPFTGTPENRERYSQQRVWIQHESGNYLVEPWSYLTNGFVEEAKRGPQEGIEGRVGAARSEAYRAISRLLTPDSEWKYIVEDGKSPYDMSLAEVDEYMDEVLKPIYTVVDSSLNQYRLGFNTHDAAHANRVKEHALLLLDQQGADQDILRRTIIASLAHDIGNLVSRDMHAIVSHRMLAMSLPSVAADREQWERVQQAIRLHDSELTKTVIDRYGSTSRERIEEMRKRFCPETLAIQIADKLDHGPERLSNATNHMATIDHDPHIFVNNVGFTREVRFPPGEMVISMDYDPTRRKRNQDQKPNFNEWRYTLWALYSDRNALMTYAAFALFPQIERVSFELNQAYEVDGERRVGDSVVIRMYPDEIDEKIQAECDNIPAAYRRKLASLDSHGVGC